MTRKSGAPKSENNIKYKILYLFLISPVVRIDELQRYILQ